MDLRKPQKFRPCSRLAVSCRVSSHWHLLKQCKGRRARVAQWYVYWEALDNIKGGGCWNVTTIDKKHGVELPYLDTHTDTQSLIHTHTLLTSTSINPKKKKNLTTTHRTRQHHSLYKLISTWKIHSNTCMKEIFFVGTAKAIKCLSQQQQNNGKK